MHELTATVRLQLHQAFDFNAAAAQVAYFSALGISHLYLSPIGRAVPGSTHGYDVIDPTCISPELGGEAAFRGLVDAARANGMGVIVDIVPNHMATDWRNAWWRDVLANGERSDYASYFDIDWRAPMASGKVDLPLLDGSLAHALGQGALHVAFDHDSNEPCLYVAEQPLPMSKQSLLLLLTEAGVPGRRQETRAALTARWLAARASPGHADRLEAALAAIRTNSDLLRRLVEAQHYRLADWRRANDVIHYRRFFDINSLIALAMEFDHVFDAVHALPLRLIADGWIDGLRIDHVDGLSTPGLYLKKLRAAIDAASTRRPGHVAAHVTLHVEKILAQAEELRGSWQVDGTTGYEFMDMVAAVLHDGSGASPLRRAWHAACGRPEQFGDEERLARGELLASSLRPELAAAVRAWYAAARSEQAADDLPEAGLDAALRALLCAMPVYRTYLSDGTPDEADEAVLARAFAAAGPALDADQRFWLARLHAWLGRTSLLIPGVDRQMQLARRRFEQTAAPLNAKSVEDTAFYRHGVLLSRNEVGSDPRQMAMQPASFHAAMAQRLRCWPLGFSATATHDHKRGEDTRARLAVISERPTWFIELFHALARADEGKRFCIAADERWMLLQTLLAAWPLCLQPADRRGMESFAQRLVDWQRKALREAKLRSSWIAPDEVHEAACARQVRNWLLDDPAARDRLAAAARTLDAPGALNGLAMMVLRLTAPGVPDLYQGTEFWDQSLVDPDNRRPVDYAARGAALNEAGEGAAQLEHFRDGRIKQAIIARLLALRRAQPELFLYGDYQPLALHGAWGERALAFIRRHRSTRCIVVVPRLCAPWLEADGVPHVPAACWDTTHLRLVGEDAACTYENICTARQSFSGHAWPLGEVFAHWPVAVLLSLPPRFAEDHEHRA